VNPFGSTGKDDETPFAGSGLKIKTIKTRRQLNEAEFESILRVTEKYLLSKPSHKLAPFTFNWLLHLADATRPTGDHLACHRPP
jgi:hypothetical protein